MTTYYVSTSGSDTNNGTSLGTPFKTPSKAATLVNPGDTVYIRGGTYSGTGISSSPYIGFFNLTRAGSAVAPITWSNYNGETVIFDGANNVYPNVGWEVGLIHFSASAAYNTVTGFTTRWSSGDGIRSDAPFSIIKNCISHNNWWAGIYIGGNDGLIEDCIQYESGYQNLNGRNYWANNYMWSSGIFIGPNATVVDGSGRHVAYRGVIRRCKSFHTWGEGINLYECSNSTMEDCEVYDNFAVNVYLSDAQNCVVQRNLIYTTSYSDNFAIGMRPSIGIAMSSEVQVTPTFGTATLQPNNNTIINNVVSGTCANFKTFRLGGGWTTASGMLVANNTFINARQSANGGNGGTGENVTLGGLTFSSSRFANNIIIQDDANTICTGAAGITFDHNVFSRTGSTNASGTGDYIGNPQLYRTGWDGSSGTLTKEYFRPISGSASLAKAAVIATNPLDLEKVTRSGTTPTAGALETQVGGSGVTDWSNTITPWTSTVVGDTYAAAVVQRSQSTNSIKIVSSGGSDIYGTADGFSAGYQSASGDFDVKCRVQSMTGGAQYAKVGIDVRQSLTAGSAHYGLMKQRNTAGSDVLTMYQFSRFTVDGTTSATLVPASETINWVRSRRIGSLLEFMYSVDGTTWTTQTSITLSGWAETVYVCLSVCSASLVSASTAILDNISMVQSLPAPWVYSDVGVVGPVGSATYSSGSYVVNSGGSAIAAATDSFGFVNRQKTGDFDLRVRVPVGPSNTSNWAKAGLMVRSTMAVGASFFCVDIMPTGTIELMYRPSPDGSTAVFLTSVTGGAKHLRLTRAGNTFTAYYSTDGSSWTAIGNQMSITLPSTSYIGPFVHSNDVLYLSSATFDALSVTDTVSTQANLFFMDL